ncbi:MAG TPA: SDR family oxidoreductase [Pyrinomonadaceae bacterium]|nr:SDR family oxidoreductase [Pyrinomonadaceae bacterium]
MSNKVALVTGASSGIGRATALIFAREGWNVAAVGRNEAELNKLKTDGHHLNGSIKTFLADVLENSQIERVINDCIDNFSRLDCVVNAAGIIKSGTIENTSLDEWDKMLDVNLRSVFYIMQRVIPHLEKTRGSIVNVSSITGTRAFPGVLAYCVSKAGVDQLTRCAALELAQKGIRVNAVNPGVVETNLHKRGGMSEEEYEKFLANSVNTHPLGRAGQPEEVAELIYFLASEKAQWITGVTYAVDGGRSQTCAR